MPRYNAKVGRYENRTSMMNKRRDLRRRSTKAEQIFWYEVKGNALGVKFRRQYSIGSFIVDFYCHQMRLIVEIDGNIHFVPEQIEYDRRREKFLRMKGFYVIRFRNDEILYNMSFVLERLRRLIEQYQREGF